MKPRLHLTRWTVRAALCVVLCGALHGGPSRAAESDAVRIRELEQSFRCLVCQNEALADSSADLAADLRGKIAEQVANGATDAQVRDYMVRRYGDFVLYKPPFKPLTWLLWLGPFLLLCAGALVLARVVARRRAMRPPQLSADERRRADALLNRTSEDCGP
ncbi:Cytochrome c heme lyase subunit CcmL [Caballeronia glathei]|uniref:Cytochrome c-type biogenesis protein n=1 Tax=Caballeronia glathei TaxID=60547 RepID=A0A069PJZ2_9BURK|nr:cytochrome c-type biogenesis protein [Caballeronia glathei]KDR41043.1 cytochrome C biogenesis protein [Caballeronia glathei]CDY73329.1 Cytochrome c heme lyase subunit CcmL [Caballeronia glathei]